MYLMKFVFTKYLTEKKKQMKVKTFLPSFPPSLQKENSFLSINFSISFYHTVGHQ